MSTEKNVGEELHIPSQDQDYDDMKNEGSLGIICAICLEYISLQETALLKGCEHPYWAYKFEETVSEFLKADWFKPWNVEEDTYNGLADNYYNTDVNSAPHEETNNYYNRDFNGVSSLRRRQETRPLQLFFSSQNNAVAPHPSTLSCRGKRALKEK
ncbi:hypothetical protein V6N13_095613 [Hibiscus sabdariffa]|uniref:Uncharacterized protein n=1 Tax=Hibiscus sabdariffa TaxID=183260 RepID=A0ABR2B6S4_9ROSI